jgi:hypothetical protein
VQTNGQRINVIGSGVAGLIATYLLRRRFDVLLFESDDRLGVSVRDTEIKRFHVHAHPASGYRAHDGSMQVSYDMNRLTRLEEPRSHVVTLNPSSSPPSESVIAKMGYQHPVYTPESVAAQRRLPELSDGVCEWGAMVRLRYESTVVHGRRIDPPYSFAHRVWLWLIDLGRRRDFPGGSSRSRGSTAATTSRSPTRRASGPKWMPGLESTGSTSTAARCRSPRVHPSP